MEKFITTYDVGTNLIDLTKHAGIVQMRPTEMYLKRDGAIGDKPSLCIVFEGGGRKPVCGQLSLETWSKALLELGYKIEPVQK